MTSITILMSYFLVIKLVLMYFIFFALELVNKILISLQKHKGKGILQLL